MGWTRCPCDACRAELAAARARNENEQQAAEAWWRKVYKALNPARPYDAAIEAFAAGANWQASQQGGEKGDAMQDLAYANGATEGYRLGYRDGSRGEADAREGEQTLDDLVSARRGPALAALAASKPPTKQGGGLADETPPLSPSPGDRERVARALRAFRQSLYDQKVSLWGLGTDHNAHVAMEAAILSALSLPGAD